MEKLSYDPGYSHVPIPEHEKNIPAVTAEFFTEIPMDSVPRGLNILEGLCFDRNGSLYACHVPASKIYRIDMVFDHLGGFYFSDLGGSVDHPTAGVFYVEPDYRTVRPIIETGMVGTNGIALDPAEKGLWVTEFGVGRLHYIKLEEEPFSVRPLTAFVPYHFTGLDGPDSCCIDEDGNLYVALCGRELTKHICAPPISIREEAPSTPRRCSQKLIKAISFSDRKLKIHGRDLKRHLPWIFYCRRAQFFFRYFSNHSSSSFKRVMRFSGLPLLESS